MVWRNQPEFAVSRANLADDAATLRGGPCCYGSKMG